MQFVRYRRWSCMNELRLQVEKQLKKFEDYGHDTFIKQLPPYPFPAKSRLFKNKSTVAGKDELSGSRQPIFFIEALIQPFNNL